MLTGSILGICWEVALVAGCIYLLFSSGARPGSNFGATIPLKRHLARVGLLPIWI